MILRVVRARQADTMEKQAKGLRAGKQERSGVWALTRGPRGTRGTMRRRSSEGWDLLVLSLTLCTWTWTDGEGEGEGLECPNVG